MACENFVSHVKGLVVNLLLLGLEASKPPLDTLGAKITL